ncbi:hypothetical protein J1N35_015163 [Gossypium stocksii]|uniref:Uncharacterized protein n=1 Tax=Gossypium stocksii TaxID=47602 RepID=A0A9D4AAK9_9ROSI|nr:hypothetical protein J1N35_015163 [Gossypium stocksii]
MVQLLMWFGTSRQAISMVRLSSDQITTLPSFAKTKAFYFGVIKRKMLILGSTDTAHLSSYREHIFGNKKFSMRVKFNEKGAFQDISVECSSDGMDPVLEIRVDGKLAIEIPSYGNLDLDCTIKDVTTKNGSWNLDLFCLWIPEKTIRRIVSIPPLHPLVGPNKIAWLGTSRGTFSLNSAYWKMKESSWDLKDSNWNIPWKFHGPQRVRLFI